jgi:hypothetical protein
MGVGVERLLGGSTAVGAAARPTTARARGAPARRGVLIGVGLAAGALAAVAGALVWARAAPGTSAVATAEMERLLRFMALVKAIVPAGALWGLVRRVRRPAATGRLAAYGAGLWASAAGAALVSQPGHVGPGAALFHAGWLTMLAAAWRDDALVARRR